MYRTRHKGWFRRAQSTAEYVTLFAIIIGAVVAMQLFVNRAVKAKSKDAFMFYAGANGLNIQGKLQYEPYYSTQNIAQTSNSTATTTFGANFVVGTTTTANTTYATGSYEVQEADDSLSSDKF